MHTELQLAKRVAQGERRAFEEFVDIFGARVHNLVRKYVDNPTDAEDITQEIFCDIHRSIGAFRGESALGTWVYRVALHHCWKRKGRRAPESIAYDEMTHEIPSDDWRLDPEACAAKGELAAQVRDALGSLSEAQQDVVVLCELQGMTYRECAEVLKIPIGTVKSRLFHAFRRLRGLLNSYIQDDPSTPEGAADPEVRKH